MSPVNCSLSAIMQTQVTHAHLHEKVPSALAKAKQSGDHHMPVMDGDALVGFVCTCDLYKARLGSRVQDVMRKPVTLERHDSVVQAAETMRDHAIGSVLVLDEGRLCGIVTRGQLLHQAPRVKHRMGPVQCDCCGLANHLRTDSYGQTLCVYCEERASGDSWFELGGEH